MNLPDVLFYIFSALTLGFGLLVIANPFSRNPVTSAMFLVLTLGALAALFVLLHAFFLAAIQILVYAGAVMVLFLFVIMLLDLKAEARQRIKTMAAVAGLIAAAVIFYAFVSSMRASPPSASPEPQFQGQTTNLGVELFSHYVLPFEVVSLLLLVAMVGVVLLSKKELK